MNNKSDQDRPQAKPAEPVNRSDEQRLIAALSYIGILFLVPLLYSKKDEEIKFHLQQGIVLFVVDVVAILVGWIPIIGWLLVLFALAASIYGFIQAWQGVRWEIPFLHKYARQIRL
ncbi:hypothetical protein A2480_03670 [Candidatus Uhrbacteria bacterium RIFOXYC2_FULL_47_19]|uniref:DUF4870 domain-containing protein n=1 Tax=Candidatus Uhrbacteria bacterium RIFOXYC2_FULL_47_19 TaxID=1802424 RepID=A0A1F7WC43_9BACT|nr:MAG: hypothetical protein A2480_03670 [Candidatus Uhrbacteria bacterium RIFOXYC2_FULL_47_19]HCC21943.1 hypothetical protein [Candidatus Uhrbacteria bacterium]